jgi:hypothetical protein
MVPFLSQERTAREYSYCQKARQKKGVFHVDWNLLLVSEGALFFYDREQGMNLSHDSRKTQADRCLVSDSSTYVEIRSVHPFVFAGIFLLQMLVAVADPLRRFFRCIFYNSSWLIWDLIQSELD